MSEETYVPIKGRDLTIDELIKLGEQVKHLKRDRRAVTESTIKRLREYYTAIHEFVEKYAPPESTKEERDGWLIAISKRRYLSTLIQNHKRQPTAFAEEFFKGRSVDEKILIDFMRIQQQKHTASCDSYPNMEDATKFAWCPVAVHLVALGWPYEDVWMLLWMSDLLAPSMTFNIFLNHMKNRKGWIRREEVNIRTEYKHMLENRRKKWLDQAHTMESAQVKVLERELYKQHEKLENMSPDHPSYVLIMGINFKTHSEYETLTGKKFEIDLYREMRKKVVQHNVENQLKLADESQLKLSMNSELVDVEVIDVYEEIED